MLAALLFELFVEPLEQMFVPLSLRLLEALVGPRTHPGVELVAVGLAFLQLLAADLELAVHEEQLILQLADAQVTAVSFFGDLLQVDLHILEEVAELVVLADLVQTLLVMTKQFGAKFFEASGALWSHVLAEGQPQVYRFLLQRQGLVEQLLEYHQVILTVGGAGRRLARHQVSAHVVTSRPF